jgi:hypothetical protein
VAKIQIQQWLFSSSSTGWIALPGLSLSIADVIRLTDFVLYGFTNYHFTKCGFAVVHE